jgi:hypothetical protein
VLYNCALSANSGTSGGGANSAILYNCTLAGNLSQGGGGAALYYNDSSGTNYDGYCTLNYCCTTPLPTNGVGNISNEPVFSDFANGDFHLYPSSPCINAGNNAFVSGSLDLDGAPRIVGGTVDMGAFEVQVPGPPGPPFIYTQPLSQTVYSGSNVTIKAAAVGQAQMSWQWWFNSAPIPNATNTSFSLQSVTTNRAGNYVVVITNILGSTTSHVGVLTVLASPSAPVSYVALDSPNPTPPYSSWATAAHTIQDAVDAAGPGDAIVVTNGVYAYGGRIVPADSKSSRVMVDKAVTVRR